MTELVLPVLAVILGLGLLAWSADQFVDGASLVATKLGVPPLLIGMFLIGFGTSAPELVVSLFAALDGASSLALGNAYGSNISNIGLILGLTTLIATVHLSDTILKRELPILLAVTLVAIFQLLDDYLSRIDGVVLLGLISAVMSVQIWRQVRVKKGEAEIDLGVDLPDKDQINAVPTLIAVAKLIGGMGLLVASSKIIVWGSVIVATHFGVSDLVIGLTVVAIGTSLPELASTVAAARRGESDLAVGNIVGSNFFNTLAVVGLAAVVHPFDVPQDVVTRDVVVMLVFTVMIWPLGLLGQKKLGKKSGILLLSGYIGYTAYLVYQVTAHL